MLTDEEILALCILCQSEAPKGSRQMPVTYEGRDYQCAVCPECAPFIEARDRATYNFHIPHAHRNLTRLLSNA